MDWKKKKKGWYLAVIHNSETQGKSIKKEFKRKKQISCCALITEEHSKESVGVMGVGKMLPVLLQQINYWHVLLKQSFPVRCYSG